jgi:CMP-N-acetylneuraminic acid synthetase
MKFKILCVIPARSGSKGLPDKNIKCLNNIPLIGLAGIVSNKCNLISKTIISTDSLKYQKIAKKYFIESPFLRPNNLSGDFISDLEVLKHSLIESELIYKTTFDYVVMLQPTSPFRNSLIIESVINHLIKNDFDSVWTISEIDKKFNPLKQLVINGNFLTYFSNEGRKIIARQQLGHTFIRNGQCYIFSRKSLLIYNTIFPDNTGFLITPNYPNIDNLDDFNMAEKYFSKYLEEFNVL